jgi:hypothetical protein
MRTARRKCGEKVCEIKARHVAKKGLYGEIQYCDGCKNHKSRGPGSEIYGKFELQSVTYVILFSRCHELKRGAWRMLKTLNHDQSNAH